MALNYPKRPVAKACKRCAGTGSVLAGLAPTRFKSCPRCSGRRGSLAAPHWLHDARVRGAAFASAHASARKIKEYR
jgi:hypothetical protein